VARRIAINAFGIRESLETLTAAGFKPLVHFGSEKNLCRSKTPHHVLKIAPPVRLST
jgi:hypothetical protein